MSSGKKLSRLKIRLYPCFFAALVLMFTGFCKKPDQMVEFQGQALGAKFDIKYIPAGLKIPETEIADYIQKFFIDLQNKTSLYQESSELISLNRDDFGGWRKVSDPLGIMISYALKLSEKTQGYYDITAGALSKLWNIDSLEKVQFEMPGDRQILAAKKIVGYDKLEIIRKNEGYFVHKKVPGMIIDLASLTAGFAADRIAEYLESRNIYDYLVDVGGEFRAGGKNNLNDWIVAVENPLNDKFYQSGSMEAASPNRHRLDLNRKNDQRKNPYRIILKKRFGKKSLATSGSYKNFIKNKGLTYPHIMDPHTGKPVDGNLVSVSVIEEKCMEADALATAIFAMGENRGFDFAVKNHIPVLMMAADSGGKLDVKFTPEMREYLAQ